MQDYIYGSMQIQVWKYVTMHICKFACMEVCNASMQVCMKICKKLFKFASMKSMQVCMYTLIDVVDKLEKLHSKVSQNDHESSTTKKKPLFRNPMDIPNFNEIEIVDVEIHNEQINESAASMDDFVPDVSQDELVNQRPSLNSQNLTNQLNI